MKVYQCYECFCISEDGSGFNEVDGIEPPEPDIDYIAEVFSLTEEEIATLEVDTAVIEGRQKTPSL